MGHRYYAPTIAEATGGDGATLGGDTGSSDQGVGNIAYDRWTQKDPLNQFQDPREGNRYVYAGCDPVNLSDPRGLFSSEDALQAGGGAAAIAGGIALAGACTAGTYGVGALHCGTVGASLIVGGGVLIGGALSPYY